MDFSDILIKGRSSKGNIVSKYAVKRIDLKEKGVSTLKPRKIWFDEVVGRLNLDGRGELLGEFKGDDLILIITQKGIVKTIKPEITIHFDEDMIVLEKWNPKKPISAIYFDGAKERYYVKRFLVEQENKEELFISEHPKSVLELVSTDWRPMVELEFTKPRGKDQKPNQEVNIEDFISIKGIKALGNQLTTDKIKSANVLESLPYEEVEEVIEEPEKEEELKDEEGDSKKTNSDDDSNDDDTEQTTLF